jgi:hypothetical protein
MGARGIQACIGSPVQEDYSPMHAWVKPELYPVATAATLLGLSQVWIYRLIRRGEGDNVPENGLYLHTATHEELQNAGINLDIAPQPWHWISSVEMERFAASRRCNGGI